MVVYWIQQIVEFVTTLYQQGFNLGIPIERCLLVNLCEMNKVGKILENKGLEVDEIVKQSF